MSPSTDPSADRSMFKAATAWLIVVLVACGAVWIWSTLALRRQVASDAEFYRLHVAPGLTHPNREWDAKKATPGERKQAMDAWIKAAQETSAHLEQMLRRKEQQHHLREIRTLSELSAIGAVVLWSLTRLLLRWREHRGWVAADRPPVPGAGTAVRGLAEEGRIFEAREGGRSPRRIEIDAPAGRIRFHGFSFVTSFWRNPAQTRVELDCSGLLIVTIYSHRTGRGLRLRTSRGVVNVPESLQPFDKLAQLLFDIAELNRADRAKFRALLAQEPKVKVPLTGWLAFLAALGAVAGIAWWLWSLGG
jgi:hypothetical protein